MLEAYGIETAADVNYGAVINVPGFGPALTQKVIAWKTRLEARFHMSATAGIDPRDVADLDGEIGQKKSQIELELRAGPNALQQCAAQILARRRALEGALSRAAEEFGQAKADLAAVR
jgi:DNA-binding helix-hairpin-helix protein with protein kinase domain